jgi:hypothetical protein
MWCYDRHQHFEGGTDDGGSKYPKIVGIYEAHP